MKLLFPSLLLAFNLLVTSTVYAQINWTEADNIAPGAPVRAAGIVEIRDAVSDIRRDLDAGNTISGDLDVESIMVSDAVGIRWESGINSITHNDGGGNVQIRFGNDYTSSSERFTQGGGSAFYIGGAIDSPTQPLEMKVGTNASPANNDAVTWGPTFRVTTGGINTDGDIAANGTYIWGDGKRMLQFNDSWLRLNQNGEFTSGTYTPGRFIAAGGIGIGTTNPSASLHVEDGGDASLTSTGHALTLGQQGGLNLAIDGNEIMARNNGVASDLHLQTDGGNFYIRNNEAAGTRFVSLNNGNVGIGTSSPSDKLEVAGSIRSSAGRNLYFGTGNQRLYGDSGSAIYADSGHSSVTQMIFRDNEDTTYGRVYGDGNGGNFGLLDGDGNWGVQMVKDNNINFRVNNVERMRIENGGDVGIGVTNPSAKLHVSGTTRLDGILNITSPMDQIRFTDGTDDWWWMTKTGVDNKAFGVYSPPSDGGAQSGFKFSVTETGDVNASGTVTASNFVGDGSGLTGIVPTGAVLDSTPGNWEVASNSNSSAFGSAALEVRELNNGGSQSGAVAQAPRIAFHWGGRVASQIGMDTTGAIRTFNNPGTGYERFVASSLGVNTLGTGNLAAGASIAIGDSDTGIRQMGDGQLAFFTNNAEEMRITNTGNVGIGTTAPAANLHLANTGDAVIRLEADTDNVTESDNPRIDLVQDGGGVIGRLGFANNSNSLELVNQFNEHLSFGTNNAYRMRILNNGNVGIGTTGPTQRLHVVGNSYLQGTVYLGSTDTALFRDAANRIATDDQFYVRSGSDNTYLYSTNTYLGAGSGDTTHLRGNNFTWNQGVIQGNGNVGIGTTSPASKLHVVNGGDEMRFTNSGLIVYNPESTTAQVRLGAAWDRPGVYSNESLNLIGRTGLSLGGGPNRNDLYVNTSGNIGIGTTSPLSKLDVNGDMTVRGSNALRLRQSQYSVIHRNDNNNYWMLLTNQNDTDGGWNSLRPFNINLASGNVSMDGSTLHVDASNNRVGIGTSAPAGSLQVNASNPELILVESPYATGDFTSLGVLNDGLVLSSQAPARTYPEMFIQQGGNVGIGTTTPTEKLDVGGNIQAGNGSGAVALTINDGAGNANVTFNHTATRPDQNGNAGRISVNTDSTSNAYMAFQLASNVQGGTNTATDLKFRVNDDGRVWAQRYCDENGNNCIDHSPAANAPRMAIYDEIVYTGGTLAQSRTSWNNMIAATEAAGGPDVVASQWRENCWWNTNETLPTSSNNFAAGHETLRERLDWCGGIICRNNPQIEMAPGHHVHIWANGGAPYIYSVACVTPLR